MGRLDRILKYTEICMAVIAGLLLVFVTVSMCLSITLRALNLQVPLWSVQFNEYSLLWIAMFGGAWLLRKDKHVSLDTVTQRLKPGKLKVLRVIHASLGFIICGILAGYSGAVVWDNYKRGVMDVRAVDVPKYLILSTIFIGFLLMAFEFFNKILLTSKQPPKES